MSNGTSSQALLEDAPAPIYPSQPLDSYAGLSIESIALVSDIGVLNGRQDRDRVDADNTFATTAFKRNGGAVSIQVISGGNAESLDLCQAAYLRFVVDNTSLTQDTALTAAHQLIESYTVNVGGTTIYTVSNNHLLFDMRELNTDETRMLEELGAFTHSDLPPSSGNTFEFLTALTDYINPTNGNPTLLLDSSVIVADQLIGGVLRADNPVVANGLQSIDAKIMGNSGFIPRNSSKVFIVKLAPFPHWNRQVALKHVNQDVTIKVTFKAGPEVFQDQVKQTFAVGVNASLHANTANIQMSELQVVKVGQRLDGAAFDKLYNRFSTYNVHCRTLAYLEQQAKFPLPGSATERVEVPFKSFQGLFKGLYFIVRPVRSGTSDGYLQIVKSYNANGQLTRIWDRGLFQMDDVKLKIIGNNSVFSSNLDDDDTCRVIANLENFHGRGSALGRCLYYVPFNWSALIDADASASRIGGGYNIPKDFTIEFTMPRRADLNTLGFTDLEITVVGYQYSDVVVTSSGKVTSTDLKSF